MAVKVKFTGYVRLFQLLDLKMEAAYNLQLLYQHNKNPTMARYIMEKYIVIE